MRRTRGSVLVGVIWTLIMLSIFLLAVTRQASSELFFGQWMRQQVVMRTLAQAGLERALFELQTDSFVVFDAMNEHWASNEKALKDIPLGEGSFAVRCEESGLQLRFGACDESARLNVNTAAEPVLQNLFKVTCKLNPQQALGLARAVEDWRDGDDAVSGAEGAESAYYKALPVPYEPRNGPLESAEELAMVKGITPEIFAQVRPYVTVYTDGKVNFNTALPKVLEALGLYEETALKLAEFRNGNDLTPGTEDDEVFQTPDSIPDAISAKISLSAEEIAKLTDAVAGGLASVRSDVFRIHSFGRLMKGTELLETQVTEVVKRDGSVLYWKEGAEESYS